MPDLQELKRLAQAATAGPWSWSPLRPGALPLDQYLEGSQGGFVAGTDTTIMHFGANYTYYPQEGQPPNEADRRFIEAANPATVLALIEKLEALTPVEGLEALTPIEKLEALTPVEKLEALTSAQLEALTLVQV